MSITITITIEGGKASATTVADQSTPTVSSHTPTLATSISKAMDAGAAPSEMELSGMLGLPRGSMEQPKPIEKAGYTDAGVAPSFSP